MRHTAVIGVHLVLRSDDGVLLGLRRNTAFAEGQWHLCAGHLEAGESVVDCAVREAHEELGIGLDPADVTFVHALHDRDPDDGAGRVQLFFAATRWAGEIAVREPEYCAQWGWFPEDSLPTNTVPYTRRALADIRRGRALTCTGWAS